MRKSRFLCSLEVAKAGRAFAIAAGKTPYDVLGVPRNASNERIRTAFRGAAKSLHPDLNTGDLIAEQQFRQLAAAYEILKRPEKKAAYDQYLTALEQTKRRERFRRFAAPAVAGLVSGSIVASVVWLAVSLSRTQVASTSPLTSGIAVAEVSLSARQEVAAADDSGGRKEGGRASDWGADTPNRPEQSASLHPVASETEPQTLLAREWERVEASGGLMAIWAFAVRNPKTPEAELARSKLTTLIDTADDVSLLQVLHLVASDAIAERAQERLVRLGAVAAAKADSLVTDAPSSNFLLAASGDEANKVVLRSQRSPAKRRSAAKQHGAVNQRSAAGRQRPDQRKLSGVQEAPCGALVHGRCIGRDPDPTVRHMIRHDSSFVND